MPVVKETHNLPIRALFVECNSPIAAARVVVDAGIEADGEGQHGLAHLVEHLACADTKRLSSADVRRARAIIGDWNAWTNYDRTVYWQQFMIADAEDGVRLLLEGVFGALNSPDEFEKQRSIILQEIKDRLDNPWANFYDKAYAFIFGDRYEDGAGDPETFPSMPIGSVLKFRQEFYHPDNATLIIAGPSNTSFVEKIISGVHKADIASPRTRGACKADSPYMTLGKRFTYPSKGESCRVAVFCPGMDLREAVNSNFEPDLIASVLGGGLHGLIVERLREELGIVYGASSHHTEHRGFGFYSITASCAYDKAEQVEREINDLLDSVARNPDQLRRAVEAAIGAESFRLVKGLSSASTMTGYGSYWPETDAEYVQLAIDFVEGGAWRVANTNAVMARTIGRAESLMSRENRVTVATVKQ